MHDLAALEATLTPSSSYEATIEALEKVSSPLGYAWGVVGHLNGVKNSEGLREALLPLGEEPALLGQALGQVARAAVLVQVAQVHQEVVELVRRQRGVVFEDALLRDPVLRAQQLPELSRQPFFTSRSRLQAPLQRTAISPV